MSIFDGFLVNASGMTAQRARMDTIISNMANVNTTRTPDGTPYQRKDLILLSRDIDTFHKTMQEVVVGGVVQDSKHFIKRYEPNHPDADKDGYVLYPDINPVEEMVNLISASRAFESNVTAMNTLKEMMMKALELGR